MARRRSGSDELSEAQARVAELERERELLNAIANHAPSLLCIVDGTGRVRPFATNRAFERTLGYEPAETGGVLFWERYVPPEDAEATRAGIERVVAGGEPREQDGRWLARDGRIIEVAWSCTALPMIASGPLYLVGAADVTERKRHEQEVRRSRARIVAAADDARRRLERNLHDGAQQRLIALLLALRVARARAATEAERDLLASAVDELATAVAELRELAQGLHPVALTEQGLAGALAAAAERAPLPVELEVTEARYPAGVEAAAYYIVSEALANVAKYAQASEARVTVREAGAELVVEVRDDGVGGADGSRGTGLRGLADRVEALEGELEVESPPGRGTRVAARLPLV